MAGTNPEDIDVVELHDAFTIMEIMAYEDLFFTSKGEGGKFLEPTEQVSVNPRGRVIGLWASNWMHRGSLRQRNSMSANWLDGRKTSVKGCN